jgi:hypothetical protein
LSSRFQDANVQAKKQEHKSQAKELNEEGRREEEHSDKSEIEQGKLEEAIGDSKELQARTPWHREGSDVPPVQRNRSASAMTKGMLLTDAVVPFNVKDDVRDLKLPLDTDQ